MKELKITITSPDGSYRAFSSLDGEHPGIFGQEVQLWNIWDEWDKEYLQIRLDKVLSCLVFEEELDAGIHQ